VLDEPVLSVVEPDVSVNLVALPLEPLVLGCSDITDFSHSSAPGAMITLTGHGPVTYLARLRYLNQ
jgi:hypothetical protein